MIGVGGLLSLLWLSRISPIATGAESVTIGRQYMQMFDLWKRQEVRWVFAMQFFMSIDLFGFIPHMSIWLTTNTDFLPPQLASSTSKGELVA